LRRIGGIIFLLWIKLEIVFLQGQEGNDEGPQASEVQFISIYKRIGLKRIVSDDEGKGQIRYLQSHTCRRVYDIDHTWSNRRRRCSG